MHEYQYLERELQVQIIEFREEKFSELRWTKKSW